jgi:hypothetical protein
VITVLSPKKEEAEVDEEGDEDVEGGEDKAADVAETEE